ncbi:hypothetical protein L6386_03700, partial [bacterium]|nr:hypothetical protein [bacterium]
SDFVTVRSDRFRIVSTGKVKDVSNNVIAARKIEAVIDRGYHKDQVPGPVTVLYWSEKVFAD